jgi:EmrB/QacA subfamily drug resistance transporter
MPDRVKSGTGIVLLTLATGQFLMALDSSVMNVSIATVAEDLGTDITGVQTAITAYTLVMAAFMITGGTVGRKIGLKRAFLIGCVVYGTGSFTTSIAPNLGVLLFGWSLLEGLGAVLIMPAIVGLVASNFESSERPRAYGLVASAAAIAIAVGPLIGGVVTTEWSWRWVFAGEVVLVAVILVLGRRFQDAPPERDLKIDPVATVLSALGLGLIVFGVLRSGVWGWVAPNAGAPEWLGLSPVVWLLFLGAAVLRIFMERERRRAARGLTPFLDPELFRVPQLRHGLVSFFFLFFVQMGLFFCIPLYLSVALGLSAAETGARLLPLSLTLLLAAAGIPRWRPNASPRRVVTAGMASLVIGTVALIVALDAGAGPEVVTVPLLLAGLGIGMVVSQLGAVTVSAVPDERSGEVGGLQNTFTNLGSSLGTALAGSVLVAGLTSAFLSGIATSPDVPDEVVQAANVQLAAGVPFISDEQLEDALADSGLDQAAVDEIIDVNEDARLVGLRSSLAILALAALLATFFVRRLPDRQATSA